MTKPLVIILLSTYNGEKYIREQLESLYQQTLQDYFILIRDDGSTDNTVNIIKHCTAQYANIQLIEGPNIGVINSFFSLLNATPDNTYRYYAFCDQDDVWMPHKLSSAVKQLNASPVPTASLHCSRLNYTDHQLNTLGLSAIPCTGFGNALVENSAIGCTQVFGEDIKQLILRGNPEHMMMHDWWAYLVAAAFGQVIYDAEPSMQYRQHAGNVVGWDKQSTKMLKKAAHFIDNLIIKKNGLECLTQAQHFLDTYPDLPLAKQSVLHDFLQLRHSGSIIERYQFLKQHQIQRTNKLEQLILTSAVLARLH
ncbi:MAG: glycosyltransferase family 2 protein [Methylococcales bacterium]|nr:glycosyltransferase family 2 protein [Methylococcales bacterium]